MIKGKVLGTHSECSVAMKKDCTFSQIMIVISDYFSPSVLFLLEQELVGIGS